MDIDDESEREWVNFDVPYKHLHCRQSTSHLADSEENMELELTEKDDERVTRYCSSTLINSQLCRMHE